MTGPNIYLFSSEKKDSYCLDPVSKPLQSHFTNVLDVHIDHLDDNLAKFSLDDCPVGIFTSTRAYDLARFVRRGRTFLSIGLEHGVAPFKTYTFNDRFLEYDCYISPTQMWADRLQRRHPRYAAKFTNVGYPRLDDLRERVEKAAKVDHEAWAGAAPEARDLVVFSWGVEGKALGRLPDREGIVYLIHPAMFKMVKSVKFERARVLLSEPDTAAALIAGAARIFGDYSSMTFEAACLHPRTYMFVERRLYDSDCDLPAAFFDHESEAFGEVAHTAFQLPVEQVMNLENLTDALDGGAVVDVEPVSAWAPEDLMPDLSGDNLPRTVATITDFVADLWPQKRLLDRMSPTMAALKAVDSAYRDVLGRKPDYPSALDHAHAWMNNADPPIAKTLSLYSAFAQSPEGRRRWSTGIFEMPTVSVAPVGRSY